MSGKTINARELRDPKALPTELRRIAELLHQGTEHRDILEHAADELQQLQESKP